MLTTIHYKNEHNQITDFDIKVKKYNKTSLLLQLDLFIKENRRTINKTKLLSQKNMYNCTSIFRKTEKWLHLTSCRTHQYLLEHIDFHLRYLAISQKILFHTMFNS